MERKNEMLRQENKKPIKSQFQNQCEENYKKAKQIRDQVISKKFFSDKDCKALQLFSQINLIVFACKGSPETQKKFALESKEKLIELTSLF